MVMSYNPFNLLDINSLPPFQSKEDAIKYYVEAYQRAYKNDSLFSATDAMLEIGQYLLTNIRAYPEDSSKVAPEFSSLLYSPLPSDKTVDDHVLVNKEGRVLNDNRFRFLCGIISRLAGVLQNTSPEKDRFRLLLGAFYETFPESKYFAAKPDCKINVTKAQQAYDACTGLSKGLGHFHSARCCYMNMPDECDEKTKQDTLRNVVSKLKEAFQSNHFLSGILFLIISEGNEEDVIAGYQSILTPEILNNKKQCGLIRNFILNQTSLKESGGEIKYAFITNLWAAVQSLKGKRGILLLEKIINKIILPAVDADFDREFIDYLNEVQQYIEENKKYSTEKEPLPKDLMNLQENVAALEKKLNTLKDRNSLFNFESNALNRLVDRYNEYIRREEISSAEHETLSDIAYRLQSLQKTVVEKIKSFESSSLTMTSSTNRATSVYDTRSVSGPAASSSLMDGSFSFTVQKAVSKKDKVSLLTEIITYLETNFLAKKSPDDLAHKMIEALWLIGAKGHELPMLFKRAAFDWETSSSALTKERKLALKNTLALIQNKFWEKGDSTIERYEIEGLALISAYSFDSAILAFEKPDPFFSKEKPEESVLFNRKDGLRKTINYAVKNSKLVALTYVTNSQAWTDDNGKSQADRCFGSQGRFLTRWREYQKTNTSEAKPLAEIPIAKMVTKPR